MDDRFDFEVHDGSGQVAGFRSGRDAMLFAHLLLWREVPYVRVVENATDDEAPAQTSWRFDYGPAEMPIAVKEDC